MNHHAITQHSVEFTVMSRLWRVKVLETGDHNLTLWRPSGKFWLIVGFYHLKRNDWYANCRFKAVAVHLTVRSWPTIGWKTLLSGVQMMYTAFCLVFNFSIQPMHEAVVTENTAYFDWRSALLTESVSKTTAPCVCWTKKKSCKRRSEFDA